MTRVVKKPNGGAEYEYLEKEVRTLKKQLKKKENKHTFGCCGCAMLVFIVFVVFGIFFLTRMGLVAVPYISDWVYEQVEPVYWISFQDLPDRSLTDIIRSRIEAFAATGTVDASLSLQLSQEEVSRALYNSVAAEGERFSYAQIAFLEDEMEIYLEWGEERPYAAIVRAVPEYAAGDFELEVLHTQVGTQVLPNAVGEALTAIFIEGPLNTVLSLGQRFASISNISLIEGNLYIEGTPQGL